MTNQTRHSPLRRTVLAVAAALVVGTTAAAPAFADGWRDRGDGYGHEWAHRGWEHREWRYHHHYYYGPTYYGPSYYGPSYDYPPTAYVPAPGIVLWGR